MSKKKVFFVANKATHEESLEFLGGKKIDYLPSFNEKSGDKEICMNVVTVRGKTAPQVVEVLKEHKVTHVIFEPCAMEESPAIVKSILKKFSKEKTPKLLSIGVINLHETVTVFKDDKEIIQYLKQEQN